MVKRLSRGGTRLATIPNHTIFIECLCGHSAGVSIAHLLAKSVRQETVGEVVAAARCRACGARMAKDFRIVYRGASSQALQGARQDARKEPG